MKKLLSVLMVLVLLVSFNCINVNATTTPKTFALYYGYPSCVNGLYNNESAAQLFAKYDLVVFGDGLETTTHSDHANTVAIISRMKQLNPSIKIFGYVPIGMGLYSQCLTTAQIENEINAWKQTGANGIFLDEYGYDYRVDRTRQNFAVTKAHNQGMSVIANSWNYDWVFSKTNYILNNPDYGLNNFNGNPTNLSCLLNSNDYYLFENMFCQIDSSGNYLQSSDRTASVWQYFSTIRSEYGMSYSSKFGTKLIALDGINSTWANKQALYSNSYSTSGLIDIHAYGASTQYWGANCTFVDYLP